MDSPKRGEIWFVSLEPVVGHEIGKTRPALVISNNRNNLFAETVTVLPITSKSENIYPFEVFLPNEETHLPKDSKVKCNQIRTVDKKRLINFVSTLLPEKLEMEKEKVIKETKNKILELFKPYVPKAVTSQILEGKASLPSERSETTILFVDIRGFTKLADQLDPEKATEIINNIFEPIVGLIDNHGGGINKFLGDGLMAIFGTPFSHEDDPERAARASLEIVNEI